MAKKKGAKKKKSNPAQASLEKLESRLLGYWKRKSWGEFVTLFQRHWNRARKTKAAAYWQAAVYNLLLDTLFSAQNIDLLDDMVHRVLDPQTLSEQNANCLQVARAFCNAYRGNTDNHTAQALPVDVPPPFQKLAAALQETSLTGHTALSEYVQGKRTKARKGEKHLALAARVGKHFNALREQGFQPGSVQPFTQLRKSIRDLNVYVHDQLGISSPTLNNLAILADMLRTIHMKPQDLQFPKNISNHLKVNAFQTSSHPAVQSMTLAFLTMGRDLFGAFWELSARSILYKSVPLGTWHIPAHLKEQYDVLNSLAHKNLPPHLCIPTILTHDVWTQREQMVLLMAHLHLCVDGKRLIMQYLEDLMDRSLPKDLAQAINSHLIDVTKALQRIYTLFEQLGMDDRSLLITMTSTWKEAVGPMPFYDIYKHLDTLLATMCRSPVPDGAFLFPLLKRAEASSSPKDIKSLALFKEERVPLQVTEDDVQHFVQDLSLCMDLEGTFKAFKHCLTEEDYRSLVQRFLIEACEASCESAHVDDLFGPDPDLTWTDIPQPLMRDFAEIVSSDFSLYGLVQMSAQTSGNNPPVPKNAAEARAFLDHLPPPRILDQMIDWMLTWPSTPYRNDFLATVIFHHADYLTENKGWEYLADSIRIYRLNTLATLIWDIWSERDLFSRLRKDEDFQEAVRALKMMIPRKGSPKSSPGKKKKKTLLDEVLEERKQRQKKGKG